jgi:hypothetical protein
VNARPFSLKSATVKAHTVNKQPILFLLLIIAIVQLAEGGRNDDVMALMVVVGRLMPINGVPGVTCIQTCGGQTAYSQKISCFVSSILVG